MTDKDKQEYALIFVLIILQLILMYALVVTAKILFRYAYDKPISFLDSINIFSWSNATTTSNTTTSNIYCDSFFRTQMESDQSSVCVKKDRCAAVAFESATVPEEFCFTNTLPGHKLERKMINTQSLSNVTTYLSYVTGRQVPGYDVGDKYGNSNVTCGSGVTPLQVVSGTTGLFECSKMCEDKGTLCTGFEFQPEGNSCKLIKGPILDKKPIDKKMMCYVKQSEEMKKSNSKWISNPAKPVK